LKSTYKYHMIKTFNWF